ncbi:MAG: hypothetical protein Q9182_000230 [Xanthomendoza sp. 2 TL-2023]
MPLITDMEKTIEGKTFYTDVKQPYGADGESTDSSDVLSANSTAISTKVGEDSVSKLDGHHHAAGPPLNESEMKSPSSILGEYMDESYFETGLDDADLDNTSTNLYEADKFSIMSYASRLRSLLPPPPQKTNAPNRSHCTKNAPLTPTTNNKTPSPDFRIRHFDPFTVAAAATSTTSPIINDAPDPSPSVYERLTGSRRTSPTAPESPLDTPRASSVTWTYEQGPFESSSSSSSSRNSESSSPSSVLRRESEKAAQMDGIDNAAVPVSVPLLSSSAEVEEEDVDVDEEIPWAVPEGFCWAPGLGREGGGGGIKREEREEEDWDCAEMRRVGGVEVCVRMRYAFGGRGFLRLN